MEDYGNFNYGFVGHAMGIPRPVLLCGSLYAHYTKHHNLKDDPHDWDRLDVGIEPAQQYEEGLLKW